MKACSSDAENDGEGIFHGYTPSVLTTGLPAWQRLDDADGLLIAIGVERTEYHDIGYPSITIHHKLAGDTSLYAILQGDGGVSEVCGDMFPDFITFL